MPLLRVPPSEQLLIDAMADLDATRLLCTTLGRGQFAAAFAEAHPDARVVCHVFDVYLADQVKAVQSSKDIQIHCAADLPNDEVDAFVMPVDMHGEAELTREILQSGYDALRVGGRFVAATANPRDHWLYDELRKLCRKVIRRPAETGVVYLARKDAALRKRKRFECEFAFRDGGRLIKACSRPGVFSHRSLDGGARALMNVMQIRAGDRVLDLGCGCGAVGFAAAFRADDVQVTAVDSHTRAVQCTQRGAELNALANVQTVLNADGECGQPGTFDVAVANPPYYSDYKIAGIFLQSAQRALRPGGRMHVVTKHAAWYTERMPQLFGRVLRHEQKRYVVLEAQK